MENILVIVRGNSASGKTFLSNKIQKHYGYDKCLLLHQDVIRRDILHANDHQNTPAIKLIDNLIDYGLSNYPITIVEGILRRDVYGDMLNKIVKRQLPNSLVYYLDIPFETTVKYDKTKPEPFGVETLKSWWRSNDYLGVNDRLLKNGETLTFLTRIISDIKEHIEL
ncbi:kinase [Leuconostoc pseudomesenteroides]|uniref:kinase n=1 Tax=Leuconostoc pseudomesenteroides TaxID=33968 RepID=UPI00166677F3|nr:kinase [Leuconostoc pseudomesenteroides]MCT4380790.1 zeta toxin family protein [Leuconostoc pseudomesenteroides]